RPRASASASRRYRPGSPSVSSFPWASDPSLGTVRVGRVPPVASPARRTGHLWPGAWDRVRLPACDRTWFHPGRAVGAGDFAHGGGQQGGHGDGRVPVPQRDRVRGPEPGVGLLALRASQPAERIDPPPNRDRTGADVRLAERFLVRVVRYAGAHLAPGERYPQLVADRRPRGDLYRGLLPRSARSGPRRRGGGPGIAGTWRCGGPSIGGGR